MGFLDVTARPEKVVREVKHAALLEGRKLFRAYNSTGGVPFPSAGNSTGTTWRSATPPTTSANTWYRAQATLVPVVPGRAQLLYSVEVEATGPCELALLQFFERRQTLDGGVGNSNLDYQNATHSGSLTAAGRYRWEWPDGLIVRSGERLDLYYAVAGTTGVNWQCNLVGYDITDDFDFDAPVILVIGDSISGITADSTDVKCLRRGDGTMAGMWPFLVKAALAEQGARRRVVNLAVGGTNTSDWDAWAAAGKLDGFVANELVINLGINDCSTSTLLSTSIGVDGGTKKGLKHIVRVFRRLNPTRPVFINQIPDTDLPARLAIVGSGLYSGQTRLAAYRQDVAAAVTEMKALGWPVYLSRTDLAYSAATGSAFLSTEVAGQRTHPNGTVGQPAMAAIIATTIASALGLS